MVDINRSTSGVLLPEAVSSEILAKVQEASIIQTAARRVALPGSGVAFQQLIGDPAAAWVGETEDKPVSNGSVTSKVLRPYKLAVIETFSNEFRRDKGALYQALIGRLPGALAKKFDMTAFHGTAPGSDFDTLDGVDAIDLGADVYDGFVSAVEAVAVAGYDANGIILAPQAEALLYSAKDLQDRPLFINNVQTEGTIGSALGRPIFKSRAAFEAGTPNTVGFMGDWTQALWGTVEDVQVKISDQATLVSGETTINLFQQNMFAVLAEIEVGFLVADEDAFVKFTAEPAGS
jgi:HK97 family phage major capsid protein